MRGAGVLALALSACGAPATSSGESEHRWFVVSENGQPGLMASSGGLSFGCVDRGEMFVRVSSFEPSDQFPLVLELRGQRVEMPLQVDARGGVVGRIDSAQLADAFPAASTISVSNGDQHLGPIELPPVIAADVARACR